LTSKLPSNMVYQHFPPEVAILFRNLWIPDCKTWFAHPGPKPFKL
jgi:hypothetical protein